MSAPSKPVFKPQDTCDTPSDVTIIVEDGKEFQAHKHILADASPFFKKLLSSDMRESKDGVVRLQMLTEFVLGDILEFIYTGCVQISDEDHAQDLIAMADFLFLPQLKSIAGDVLTRDINFSNCVSRYHSAETYQCEVLISATKKFIFANFGTVAKTDEFLNISITEVEMWISSDEINVSAEEDVFEFILAWIDHNEVDRKKYFFTLFRHVRLVYVSRDYFRTNIVTNKFVMCDTDCLDHLNKSENNGRCCLKPRKSLEVPVIFIPGQGRELNDKSVCYFPREDVWCTAPDTMPSDWCSAFPCHDQLYTKKFDSSGGFSVSRYNTFSNTSTSLSLKHLDFLSQLVVTSQNEIYALVDDSIGDFGKLALSSIMKHDQESNSWKHEWSFDWTPRSKICIINKDDVIYFVGGKVRCRGLSTPLTDAYRYGITAKKFEKVAEMKEARYGAYGAAARGKIFVTGGTGTSSHDSGTSYFWRRTCEVYNESSDEWQVIAGLEIPHWFSLAGVLSMTCVDGKLYAVGEYYEFYHHGHRRTPFRRRHCRHSHITYALRSTRIECYDPGKNEWSKKTEFPGRCMGQACSMRVFKGSEFLGKVSSPLPSQSESKNQETVLDMEDKKKCLVM